MRVGIALPPKNSIVRCRLPYPNLKQPEDSHPALVLSSHDENALPNFNWPFLIVAGGTAGVDENGRQKPIFRGEVLLTHGLSVASGLKKATKFCFAEQGIFAFPFDSDFFPWDADSPNAAGYPLYGSLATGHADHKRYVERLHALPDYPRLKESVQAAVRHMVATCRNKYQQPPQPPAQSAPSSEKLSSDDGRHDAKAVDQS